MEIKWVGKKESAVTLWIERFLLAFTMILFYSIYIDKVLPASEEWHIMYVKLMQQGKFPYRDFYYYLPPLDLFVSRFLWGLSFNSYLVYRIYRLIERIIITELVFEFLRKRVRSSYAWFGSIVGGILYSACVYDLLGDYNQTVYLIIAELMYAVDFFLSSYGNRKLFAAGLTGVCIGLLFLSKQTHFVAFCIVLGCLLLYYCLKEKDRKFIWYCIFVILGISLPVGSCTIWLSANEAFMPFVQQVFLNTDSKGSLFDIIVKSVFYLYNDENLFLLFVVCIICVIIKLYVRRNQKAICQYWEEYVFPIMAVFAMLYFYFALKTSYWTPIHSLVFNKYWTGIISALILTLLPAVLWELIEKKKRNNAINTEKQDGYLVIIISCIFLLITLVSRSGGDVSFAFYIDETQYTNYLTVVQKIVSFAVGLMLVEQIWKAIISKEKEDWKSISLLSIAFAANYAQKMACGKSLCTSFFYIIALPIIIVLLMSSTAKRSVFKNSVIITACMLTVLIVGCQKAQSSYRWWGWQERPVSEHTETIDIEGFRGFKVTKETKTIYEELTKVIKSNTDENSHVYGYPHNVIFNLMADRMSIDRFIPVPFYDVCSSQYFSDDLSYLIKNPPDIVVYQNIPYCYDVHRDAFQNGQELAQYEFEEWFAVNRNTLYELVGQASDFYVYKLKGNGISTGYTYLESCRVNTTASLTERFKDGSLAESCETSAEEWFEGEGTIADPFLIESAADLINLSKAVEAGAQFIGKYFLQTVDIDMSKNNVWTPIGQYDSGSYFSGTYNGDGHVIRNINCLQNLEDAHSALFGDLAGTVMNLGILDSDFSGRLAGTVATNSYGSGAIVNCYAVNCNLEASEAVGGIASYFGNGKIENCYVDCNLVMNKDAGERNVHRYCNVEIKNKEQAYGISCNCTGIYNCLCTKYEVYEGLTSLLNSNHSYAFAKNRKNLEYAAETLNTYIEDSNNPNLRKWIYEGKGNSLAQY